MGAGFTDPDTQISYTGITDPVHDVTYGITFPPISSPPPDEFIGEIVAPLDAKWIGMSLGGAMNGDLLLVAWPNGNEIVSSTRYAQ